MARLEVYFTNGRAAKFDPGKVCFIKGPYQRSEPLLRTADEEELLATGGAIVNWYAVSFIRLVPERDEEDE